jgi:hypothetical protein
VPATGRRSRPLFADHRLVHAVVRRDDERRHLGAPVRLGVCLGHRPHVDERHARHHDATCGHRRHRHAHGLERRRSVSVRERHGGVRQRQGDRVSHQRRFRRTEVDPLRPFERHRWRHLGAGRGLDLREIPQRPAGVRLEVLGFGRRRHLDEPVRRRSVVSGRRLEHPDPDRVEHREPDPDSEPLRGAGVGVLPPLGLRRRGRQHQRPGPGPRRLFAGGGRHLGPRFGNVLGADTRGWHRRIGHLDGDGGDVCDHGGRHRPGHAPGHGDRRVRGHGRRRDRERERGRRRPRVCRGWLHRHRRHHPTPGSLERGRGRRRERRDRRAAAARRGRDHHVRLRHVGVDPRLGRDRRRLGTRQGGRGRPHPRGRQHLLRNHGRDRRLAPAGCRRQHGRGGRSPWPSPPPTRRW